MKRIMLRRNSVKVIIIWICGIGIGAGIATLVNKLVVKLYTDRVVDYTQAGQPEWYFAIPILLILFMLIPAGFLIGRIVENEENHEC